MKNKLLITDSLFVFEKHERRLRAAGFEITRLNIPKASPKELCEALRDKDAYILGGIEQVTKEIIDSAPKLRAIAFTGSGYSEFIPAHEYATQQGIAISAAKGANARAVAEYTLALMLATVRRAFSLTTRGGTAFYIAPGFRQLKVGIVGWGGVGKSVAELAGKLGMEVIVHTRVTPQVAKSSKIRFLSLSKLLAEVDIVSLHVNKLHGNGVIDANGLNKLKNGAIVINTAFPEAIDCHALKAELLAKRLWAAFDAAPDRLFADVSGEQIVYSNSQTAFNTSEANEAISDRVTSSIINLMKSGKDKDLVNPEYKRHRR